MTPNDDPVRQALDIWDKRLWELIDYYKTGAAFPQSARDSIKHHLKQHPSRLSTLPQAAAAVPLSEIEIDNACADVFGSDYGGVLTASLQRAVARAIEAAHGITPPEGAAE
jgi:hypothetical protein